MTVSFLVPNVGEIKICNNKPYAVSPVGTPSLARFALSASPSKLIPAADPSLDNPVTEPQGTFFITRRPRHRRSVVVK